jgi:hypothetical protein
LNLLKANTDRLSQILLSHSGQPTTMTHALTDMQVDWIFHNPYPIGATPYCPQIPAALVTMITSDERFLTIPTGSQLRDDFAPS